MRMKRKILFLLALLLAIVTQGTWAQSEIITTTSSSTVTDGMTFTSGPVTIKVDYDVDTDGAYINDDHAMTITATDKNITSVVLRIGFFADCAEEVLASSGTRSISGDGNKKSTWVTFSDVNASSVTITTTDSWVQIDEVTVNYTSIVPVSGVTLSQSEAVLTVGGTQTLTATVAPANATNKSVTWTTSNASVATVANGVVTAVGVGSATITATTTNGAKTASCAVTVANPIAAASADGTIGAFTDANGQTRLGIVATLDGKKYAIGMSSETDISGLSGANTVKVGNQTYYTFADACAKFANNQTDGSYTASNVWRLPTANEFSALVALGGTWDGTAGHTGYTWTIGSSKLFLPTSGYYDGGAVNAADWGYYWSSTSPHMLTYTSWYAATVGQGGTTAGMPLRLFCQLPYVNVTGVTLAQTEATLPVDGTLTLTPTIAPANATNKSVTWTTSDASVVTVDANGVVTAQGLGTATITATATNGTADTGDDLTTIVTVTVAAPINALSEVGTVGAFTDVNGQTRLGIVTMLNGSKYAISMSNETNISGLSGASTRKVGDITYYNNADARAKFANNQNDYAAANVWRLPTSTEFDALAKLGGAWDGTTGHMGWTWTIGGNTLFLPISGYYEGGAIGNPGWGYYWSSTSYPNMFVFASGYAAQVGNGGTAAGMPLRLFCQIPYVNVTGVTLAQTEGVLTVGETLTLTATIAPTNATDKSVTWTTSDASVATVDANGVVTALGLGTTTVTATATNGTADTSDDLTATCTVTVATPITAASADGTVGVFTDANGQSRLGIVVTLSGEKYAIAMSNETDLTGLSGTYTKKVGDYTYYNFADACAKFANNQTDGSYTAANVWRLPTAAEFTALIGLGGTWDNTTGHTGYIWTIGANSLFLPAAGYYEPSIQNLNSYGFYWSSNGWGSYSNMMIFYSGSSYIGQGGPSSGMPLRLFCQLPPIPSITFAEDDDNSTALSTADGNVYNVTLTRTLQTGGWNTFCAPFSTATPSGWTVKELTGSAFNSTTGELTLTFDAASSIEAGKPYLVKVDANVANPTFEGVTISSTTTTTETTVADFVPVMNPTNLTGGDKTVLFVSGGNKLTYPSADGNINGFRAYFRLKGDAASQARAFRMSFDDDVTGIVTVLSDEPTTGSGTYTLDGRRIEGQPTQKGVYIVNGKKTIIK